MRVPLADTFQEKAGLTGLSPEDAQARAKELVEAYSKGLDFSLIDKEDQGQHTAGDQGRRTVPVDGRRDLCRNGQAKA